MKTGRRAVSSLNVHRGQKKVNVSFPQSSRYSSEGIPTHTVWDHPSQMSQLTEGSFDFTFS